MIHLQGMHIRLARAALCWSQKELSQKAKVALRSIKRMEGEDGPVRARSETIYRLTAILERSGIELLEEGMIRFHRNRPLRINRKAEH